MVVGSGEQDKKVFLGIAVKFADDLAFYDCAFGLVVLGPTSKLYPSTIKTQKILVLLLFLGWIGMSGQKVLQFC